MGCCNAHEKDPRDHLGLEVVVLKVELETGVVLLGEVHQDRGALKHAQRRLGFAVVEKLCVRAFRISCSAMRA